MAKPLSSAQKNILIHKGTEPPFSGEYCHLFRPGTYTCAACGNLVFDSTTKFDSQSGWPSFTNSVNQEAVKLVDDISHGMSRTEVQCSRCGGHLGHVFTDGPPPTGLRYCINSLALDFKPAKT